MLVTFSIHLIEQERGGGGIALSRFLVPCTPSFFSFTQHKTIKLHTLSLSTFLTITHYLSPSPVSLSLPPHPLPHSLPSLCLTRSSLLFLLSPFSRLFLHLSLSQSLLTSLPLSLSLPTSHFSSSVSLFGNIMNNKKDKDIIARYDYFYMLITCKVMSLNQVTHQNVWQPILLSPMSHCGRTLFTGWVGVSIM